MPYTTIRSLAAAAAVALLTGACAAGAPLAQRGAPMGEHVRATGMSAAPAETAPPAYVSELVEEVLTANARFASFEVAMKERWDTQLTTCMASPQGGQGFHYGNADLIEDGGLVNAMTPELLMYEKQADGTMKFVGVEYMVPLADWKASHPPTLFGQLFKKNEAFGIWALHLWATPNPAGQFATWNPNVGCAN